MTRAPWAALPVVTFMLFAVNCGGDDVGPSGVGGAGGGRDFDSGAGAPNTGGSSDGGTGGSTPGSSGSSSAGGSAGVGATGGMGGEATGGGGTGGGDTGAGGIVGTGGSGSGGTATGGTDATGGATSSTGGTDATGGTGGSGTPSITAVAWLEPDSCDRPIAYEVRDVRDQNGTPVSSYTCEWTFLDFGSPVTSSTCAGEIVFADAPEDHSATVVVRDSTTGATTTVTAPTVHASEPLAIETWVDSNACLELTISTNRQYGYKGVTYFVVDIQPAENVLTPPPWSEDMIGIKVSAPGTYMVQVRADTYMPGGTVCSTSSVGSATVEDCP